MKKAITLIVGFITLFQFSGTTNVYASSPLQPEDDSVPALSFSFNGDLVSRYIWRGLPLDLHANIQPYASVTYKNFTLGAWGSYALSNQYAEADLYLSYSAGALTFTISDYYNEDETDMSLSNYFQYTDKDTIVTPHSIEGQITFGGTDNFPVSFTVATFFYGNDRNDNNKNYYSTYLELGYEHPLGDNTLSYFLGGTVAKGFYADKAAIINLGCKASRELKLSDKASLPVSAAFILNPDAKDVFFVFSLTF
jgi:hypothetical protein